LAILGDLASGRTSLLAYLALVFARGDASGKLGVAPDRLPIYISLPDMEWTLSEDERDQADEEGKITSRLVQATLAAFGGRSTWATILRRHLEEGKALILADGWDELKLAQREQAAAWLGQLADDLPGNIWIAAAGIEGFAPLTDEAFVAVRLGKWKPTHAQELMSRWADLLEPAEDPNPPDLDPLAESLVSAVQAQTNPLELTLRCWLFLTEQKLPQTRSDLFSEATGQLLGLADEESAWTAAAVSAALGQLALMLQREDRSELTRQEMEEAVESVLSSQTERPRRAKRHAIRVLTTPSGPLRAQGADRYAFAHPLWQAFLAARQLASLSPTTLVDLRDHRHWLTVVEFYAELGPMEPVVKTWLSQPDDPWFSRLCRAARWVALVPRDAEWRNGVMAVLARTFLSPTILLPVRERMAEALVQTHDPGVTYLFQQGVHHELVDVKVAVLHAAGKLAREVDLMTLVDPALDDPNPRVRAAAVTTIGAMDKQVALPLLSRILAEEEQELRTRAARALARLGEEGWEVLKEALKDEDFLTRRAAVYGLAEVEQPWTRERLTKITHTDPEWIVRSAAAAALEEMNVETQLAVAPLQISEASWLISWAAERDEPVGRGKAALPMLLRALQEGRPPIRKAAAWALGLAGGAEHIPVLRQAMADENLEVSCAALEALEELCCRHGVTVESGSNS
jgi:hypothetical protein